MSAAASSPTELVVERRDRVAVVTLSRPERRNALTASMLTALEDTMGALGSDDEVGAVVLTGAGSAFCAGFDLDELTGSGENLVAAGPLAHKSAPWRALDKPVVAAVNGPAVTGGLELVLHCDLALAATSGWFADTHARRGLLPGWGLTYLLPRAIGYGRALELSLTGRRLPAVEALGAGLVCRVVADDELMTVAIALAELAAELAPETAAAVLDVYRAVHLAGPGPAASVEAERSRAFALTHTEGVRR